MIVQNTNMNAPSYFKQEGKYNCSLAVLRMVLVARGIEVTEKDLQQKVIKDYGKKYKNIWNPTIAKLALEYKIPTTVYARWPLFKQEFLKKALKEYESDSNNFDANKYETEADKDIHESLRIAYKDMFAAIRLGCKVVYGELTPEIIKKYLKKGNQIMTSIKLNKMYPGKKNVYHAILLYGVKGDTVFYHDPFHGESLSCSISHLISAISDTGVGIVFSK